MLRRMGFGRRKGTMACDGLLEGTDGLEHFDLEDNSVDIGKRDAEALGRAMARMRALTIRMGRERVSGGGWAAPPILAAAPRSFRE
mmetsp:Transcript_32311/g.79347  ORF Transcript_32311/g.79347 Transcript_32311/m.79347 type:complete len:86 (+) Transcript_32311:567-824(+)